MIRLPAAWLAALSTVLLLAAPVAQAASFTVKNCSNTFTTFYAHAEDATEANAQTVTSWQSLAHGASGTLTCPTPKCRMQIMPHTGVGTRQWHPRLLDYNSCFLVFDGVYDFYVGGMFCEPPRC